AADIGSTGGVPGTDGVLDNNDFVVFIDWFFAQDNRADVGSTGGVARSRRLQRIMDAVCRDHGARFSVVPPDLAGDNGGMIAWTGYLALNEGVSVDVEESYVKPKWRLDEVDVPWRRGH
ncbi:MAG TPA: GC-type dockerin domain-anchored protein, partial [Candidatus Methanomethylicus sp.]|nr:GC-type dockerin domain-anchored protein [Candidatus Methanomethylicus sp.]